MNLLITGGAGFIGSHLAFEAKEAGHYVVILDNKTDGKNELNWLMLDNEGIPRLRADVLDLNKDSALINMGKDFDAIVHCAAQTAVTKSLEDPRHDFLTNAQGTFEVCEYARKNDLRILYTSTNKVYGENVNKVSMKEMNSRYILGHGNYAIDELFPIDYTGHTPYGCSKLAGDLYVQDYRHIYGLENIVFRLSCIYGAHQGGTVDQGWVSHLVRQWTHNKAIEVFGNGKQVRDILYIDDLTDLMLKALDIPKGGLYNIGGGFESNISILELFNFLRKNVDYMTYDNLIIHRPWRLADQKAYISNTTRARRKYNFRPKILPEEGIKRLITANKLSVTGVRIR